MAYIKVRDCLKDPRQLIKLILLVICISITIYQLSECVNKLIHPQITSYYKVSHNETIKYPAITICRHPAYKTHLFPKYGITSSSLYSDAFRNFRFDNYTIEEFMNATTYSFREVIALYSFKRIGRGENVIFKETFLLNRGRCHTLIPKETAETFSIGNGYWLYLHHNVKDKVTDSTTGRSTTGFEIHIHDALEVIKEEGEIELVNTDFLYLESAEEIHVTMTVESHNALSTKEKPCVKDATYSKSKCEEKCLHNTIAKEVGCKVPWLHELEGNYPQCSNTSSISAIFNKLTAYFSSKILAKCNCQNACNNTMYKYQIEQRKEGDTILGSNSIIFLYFASNMVTELTEVMSYDWNSFLADVGGSLGFLLGLSVIGIVNIFEQMIKLCFKIKSDEKKKQLPEVETKKEQEEENLKGVIEFVANCDKYDQLQEKNKSDEKMRY